MPDISKNNLDLSSPESHNDDSTERRLLKRENDPLFRVVVILNLCAWISLFVALVLFHYARPEFITGVQKYWGLEGRIYWSQEHVSSLVLMLQVCLGLSLVSTVLRSRRNRRKRDHFGVNLIILIFVTSISLATLYTSVH